MRFISITLIALVLTTSTLAADNQRKNIVMKRATPAAANAPFSEGVLVGDTLYVGGDPHFIITGLYPPSITSTPPKASSQQKTMQSNVINIVFYGLATVLFIFLLFLLLRFRKRRGLYPKGKDGSSRLSSKKRVRRARKRIHKKRA